MTRAASAEALLTASIDAFNDRDLDRFLETMAPDVEAHTLLAELAGTPFRGHDGLRRWWEETHESWEYQRIDIERVEPTEDGGVAMISLVGRGKASGVELDMRLGLLFRVRDGLCSYLRIYDDRAEARRAAGLG